MIDTSQYGDGKAVVEYFAGCVGRFLDVGCFDGLTFSNTKMLAELGWTGVCVEPSPPAFCALMRNYWDSPYVRLVNAAVIPNSQTPGLRRFLCNTPDGYAADALSSFEQSHADKFSAAGHPFREIHIPAISWSNLLAVAGDIFQFVNIDTEGTNAAVLADMPLRPELICVEYDPDADGERAKEILTGWGYSWELIGGNLLAVRG